MAQQITAQGFNYTQISVDRIDPSDKICKPYHYLKNTIYEERIRLFDSELLTEELLGLERNSNGVINHPDEGRTGSKDLADALCGAVYNASQHAEEFAFDFGENIDTIIDTNSNKQTEVREQITVDFEEELKKTFDTTGMNNNSAIDFGMGKAQVLPSLYTSQGIIVW